MTQHFALFFKKEQNGGAFFSAMRNRYTFSFWYDWQNTHTDTLLWADFENLTQKGLFSHPKNSTFSIFISNSIIVKKLQKCYFWVDKIGLSRSNFQNWPTTVYLYGYFVHHIKSRRYSDFSLPRKTHPRFALFALFSCLILWWKIWNLVKTK